jgi:hypothetical protein
MIFKNSEKEEDSHDKGHYFPHIPCLHINIITISTVIFPCITVVDEQCAWPDLGASGRAVG